MNNLTLNDGAHHLLDIKNEGLCLGKWCEAFQEFEVLFLNEYSQDEQGMMFSLDQIYKVSDEIQEPEKDSFLSKNKLSHLSFYPFKALNEEKYRFGYYVDDLFVCLKNDDEYNPYSMCDGTEPKIFNADDIKFVGKKIVFYHKIERMPLPLGGG